MRALAFALALLAPLALAACGDTEKTVVVQPPAAAAAPSTLVVPQNPPTSTTTTKVCQPGSVC